MLVTGAAGSIGPELCRQLAAHGPERLVLSDRHENGMFRLDAELRARFPRLSKPHHPGAVASLREGLEDTLPRDASG